MDSQIYLNSAVVFIAALAGGLWGGANRVSAERTHLVLALAAGLFLGVAFLDLLPTAFAPISEGGAAASAGGLALLGFLLIYVVEKGVAPLLTGPRTKNSHATVAITVLLGLSVHSLVEGGALTLPTVDHGESSFNYGMLLSITLHKGAAGVALGSLFALANFSLREIIAYVTLFALVTPLGVLVTSLGAGVWISASDMAALSAISAGVFVYVAAADMLPEVMHSNASLGWKLALLLLGVAIMWGAHALHLH